jgi:GT2 family glycosyltransferase
VEAHSGISVVMVTRDRADEALSTLQRLHDLPEAPPMVVVDNGSSDGTAERVRRAFPDVRVIALEENAGSAGRNLGVAACDTPYVAFADDDSWWAPGSLGRAAELLDLRKRLAVVSARVLVGPEEREDPICADLERSPLPPAAGLPGPAILGFMACAVAVRRSAYLEAGGFDRRMMVGGEEELLAADLASRGWEIAYVRDLTVHHHPSSHRSPGARRRVGTRNALWFIWLRRPLPSALGRTVRVVRGALGDPDARRGVLEAVRAAPWVLRGRRVVPPDVERGLRLLDG